MRVSCGRRSSRALLVSRNLARGEAQLGSGASRSTIMWFPAQAAIDERAVSRSSDEKERRHLGLRDPARGLDIGLAAVVGAKRSPGRAVALYPIAEIQIGEIEPDIDGRRESPATFWRRSARSSSCGYSQETEAI